MVLKNAKTNDSQVIAFSVSPKLEAAVQSDFIEAEYEDITPPPPPPTSPRYFQPAQAYQGFADSDTVTKGENVNQYW